MVFTLEDDSSGIRVSKIEGLGPVKATLSSSGFADSDGEVYQSSRRDNRNIKLYLELDPATDEATVWDLRKRLYRIFMTESEVKLTFNLVDETSVSTVGRVEVFDYDHFVEEPEAFISLMCFDPDFYSQETTTVPGVTTAGQDSMVIDYDGSVESGITFVLNVDRTLPDFSIYQVTPEGETHSLVFDNYPLEAGDVLTISTVAGSKGATLVRAGVTYSVLYGVSPESRWFELQPGENSIRVYAEGAAIPFDISYVMKLGAL